ncbi:putative UbiA prenyltransferase family [Dioscorea sansibarensis]
MLKVYNLSALHTDYLAASLAACNLVFHAFIYTPLKQIHSINIWVGAVVGAIPPLLGYLSLLWPLHACVIVST